MFFKKWRHKIDDEVLGIHKSIRALRDNVNDIGTLVECETCGCLLRRWKAIKGKSSIRTQYQRDDDSSIALNQQMTKQIETIYTPYYCKVHAPKETPC